MQIQPVRAKIQERKTMNPSKTIAATLLVSALMIILPACDNQGPVEEAGEEVDDAVDDMGDAFDNAADVG